MLNSFSQKPTPPKLEISAEDLQGGASPSPKVGTVFGRLSHSSLFFLHLIFFNIFQKDTSSSTRDRSILSLDLVISPIKMSSDSKLKDLHKGLFEVGLKNQREVVGDVYANKALENGSSEFAFPGQELVTE